MPTPLDFPWRPGMLVLPVGDMPAFRIVNTPGVVVKEHNGHPVIAEGVSPDTADDPGAWYFITRDGEPEGDPDPNDPATIGALLGALCEAYRDPNVYLEWDGDMWHVNARVDLDADAGFDGVGYGEDKLTACVSAWASRPVRG